MTDTEINVAIAQTLGYEIGNISSSPTPSYCLVGKDEEHWQVHEYAKIPDFCHDLNAMHAVIIDEICGDSDMEAEFLKELNTVIESYADSEDVPVICQWDMAILCSPAWALCKAFLRTLGKWRD